MKSNQTLKKKGIELVLCFLPSLHGAAVQSPIFPLRFESGAGVTAPTASGFWLQVINMDENMKQLQQGMIELEIQAEHLLLARHEQVENDKVRNGNREALTALRKRARTTKTSVPAPFESIMKDVGGPRSRPLVKEVCAACGNHDSNEPTWMMFPGTDIFAKIPFHASHSILETDQVQLDCQAKILQSHVKEKSFRISQTGVLSDKIGPGVLRSLVALTDKPSR